MIHKVNCHIPSFLEAELIAKNQHLEKRLSYHRCPGRNYEGDRPNLDWLVFLGHINQPIFSRIQTTVTQNGNGYEL